MKIGISNITSTSEQNKIKEPSLEMFINQQEEEEEGKKEGNEISNELFIFKGMIGEKTIEAKATVGDNYAILAGLLLAFCIGNLLSINSDDFNHINNFNGYVLSTTIATSFGFISVISFTMLSGKIRRLIGRSLYMFGEETEFSDNLITMHGNKKWEIIKKAYNYPNHEIRFPARQWYYNSNDFIPSLPTEVNHLPKLSLSNPTPFYTPCAIQGHSITAFYLLCISFTIAMCFKIFDAVNSQLAIICIILLTMGIIIPLIIGHLNHSLYDLN